MGYESWATHLHLPRIITFARGAASSPASSSSSSTSTAEEGSANGTTPTNNPKTSTGSSPRSFRQILRDGLGVGGSGNSEEEEEPPQQQQQQQQIQQHQQEKEEEEMPLREGGEGGAPKSPVESPSKGFVVVDYPSSPDPGVTVRMLEEEEAGAREKEEEQQGDDMIVMRGKHEEGSSDICSQQAMAAAAAASVGRGRTTLPVPAETQGQPPPEVIPPYTAMDERGEGEELKGTSCLDDVLPSSSSSSLFTLPLTSTTTTTSTSTLPAIVDSSTTTLPSHKLRKTTPQIMSRQIPVEEAWRDRLPLVMQQFKEDGGPTPMGVIKDLSGCLSIETSADGQHIEIKAREWQELKEAEALLRLTFRDYDGVSVWWFYTIPVFVSCIISGTTGTEVPHLSNPSIDLKCSIAPYDVNSTRRAFFITCPEWDPLKAAYERIKKGWSYWRCQSLERQINRALGVLHEVEIVPIKADGNCLFRAFSKALLGDESRHMETRKAIVTFMRTSEDLRLFIVSDDEREDSSAYVDTYLNEMEKAGTWGDQVEISAFTRVYGRAVRVFSYNYSESRLLSVATPLEEGVEGKGGEVWLLHLHGHYSLLEGGVWVDEEWERRLRELKEEEKGVGGKEGKDGKGEGVVGLCGREGEGQEEEREGEERKLEQEQQQQSAGEEDGQQQQQQQQQQTQQTQQRQSPVEERSTNAHTTTGTGKDERRKEKEGTGRGKTVAPLPHLRPAE